MKNIKTQIILLILALSTIAFIAGSCSSGKSYSSKKGGQKISGTGRMTKGR